MPTSDNRYELEIRKRDLARWMISHDARTGTVARWTGLSRYQIVQLCRRYNPARSTYRRGSPPSQTAYFGKSFEMEAESLAFLFIAVETQVIPEQIAPDARGALPELSRGERLMRAFECYRALLPRAHISLERAILLVFEYAERRNVSVKHCSRCNDLMLIDRTGAQNDCCPFCRPGGRSESLCAQT